MLEAFTSRGARDFRQRYEGTYGYFSPPRTDKKLLVYITNVNENTVAFQDSAGIRMEAVSDCGLDFEFLPITRKLFIVSDNLHHIARRAARQWQRGVSAGNTRIRNLTRGSNVDVSFTRLTAAYDKELDNEQKAKLLKQYLKGAKKCFLINDFFGVSEKTLYLYNNVIGECSEDTLLLKNDLFKQELLDAVRDSQLQLKVTFE